MEKRERSHIGKRKTAAGKKREVKPAGKKQQQHVAKREIDEDDKLLNGMIEKARRDIENLKQ